MTNDEIRMTKEGLMTKSQTGLNERIGNVQKASRATGPFLKFGLRGRFGFEALDFGFLSSFVIGNSSFLLAALIALVAGSTLHPLVFASDPVTGEAVECANLIYTGTKSSVCFSEEFLSAVASETSINTARKF